MLILVSRFESRFELDSIVIKAVNLKAPKFHCQYHKFTEVYLKPNLVILAQLVQKILIETYNG